LFGSGASDLSATNDPNNVGDLFVRDVQAGITTLISVNRAGMDAAQGGTYAGVISADGNLVAFPSLATDLLGNGASGGLYVRHVPQSGHE
jgi:hypothetical protein